MGGGGGGAASAVASKRGAGGAGAGCTRWLGLPPPRIAPAEGRLWSGPVRRNAGRAAPRIASAEGAPSSPPRTNHATRSSTAVSLFPPPLPPSPSHPPPLSIISLAAAARPANHAFARVGFRARHVHALPLGLRPIRPRRAGKVSVEYVPRLLDAAVPERQDAAKDPGPAASAAGQALRCGAVGGGGTAASARPSGRPARNQSRQ